MRRAFKAFDPTPQAPQDARRFVRDLVEECAAAEPAWVDVEDRVALLTTEFVSEALAHHPAAVHVLASCMEDRVRVEIYDTERASNLAEGEDSETHRIRMTLLSELADRWSKEYVGSGQLNWFELRILSS